MPINARDYNRALATCRQELPHGRAAQGHPIHGQDTVPDNYGRQLIDEARIDGADQALLRRLIRIMRM
jgi:hypothetical protein